MLSHVTRSSMLSDPPYDIPDKLMRHSLFESPIGRLYPCDYIEILWPRSWWKFIEIITFRVFAAKNDFWWNLIHISEKSNFHRKHLRYDDFLIITIFSTQRSIPAWKKIYLKNFIFGGKHSIFEFRSIQILYRNS